MTESMASEPAEPTTRPQDDVIERAAYPLAVNALRRYEAEQGFADHLTTDDFIVDAREDVRALVEAGLLADPAQTTELEELREQAANAFADTARLHGMYAKGGAMHLEIEPPHALVLAWVGAARAMLGDAPNYCETRVDAPKVEMEIKAAGEIDRYAFTIQRVGKVTPHEARQRAESERDALSLLLRGMARKLVAARAELKQEKRDGTWVLNRIRRSLGTPDGRSVSVHAREVGAERDTLLTRTAELEASIGYHTTRLGEAVAERQARIDAVLRILDEPAPVLPRTDPHFGRMNARNARTQLVDRVRAALAGDQALSGVALRDVEEAEGTKHSHGRDCCWECFHGPDSHPTEPNDLACQREGCPSAHALVEEADDAAGDGK